VRSHDFLLSCSFSLYQLHQFDAFGRGVASVLRGLLVLVRIVSALAVKSGLVRYLYTKAREIKIRPFLSLGQEHKILPPDPILKCAQLYQKAFKYSI
jgi:hypothetical protein